MKEGNNHRKILSENVQDLLRKKGKSQTDMARELGFAEATVSSWLNEERYPRIDRVQKMADYFGVYRSDITDKKEGISKVSTSSGYTYMPNTISAGLPIISEAVTEYEVETITLPDSLMGKWAGHSDIFVIKINGDSMDKIMPNGSIIAVKPTSLPELKNGDIVVFSENHEYSVKRYFKHGDNIVFKPESYDQEFYDQTYTVNDDITIHGKVVLYIVELD